MRPAILDVFNGLTTSNMNFAKKRIEINVQDTKHKIPKHIRINGILYNNPKLLSSGSFGTVIKYTDEPEIKCLPSTSIVSSSISFQSGTSEVSSGIKSIQSVSEKDDKSAINVSEKDNKTTQSVSEKDNKSVMSVCVKYRTTLDSIDSDLKIVENKDIPKDIFVPGIIKSGKIVMPVLLNNIHDLFDELEKNPLVPKDQFDSICVNVLRSICYNMRSLMQIGLYFTDLKLDNVLYYISGNKIIPLLCDHGSAFTKDEGGIFTYFPPERVKQETKKYDDPCEADIVWGIGVIMCELWNVKAIYETDTWDDDCITKLNELILNLTVAFPTGVNIIDKIFIEKEKRCSLENVIEMVNSLNVTDQTDTQVDLSLIMAKLSEKTHTDINMSKNNSKRKTKKTVNNTIKSSKVNNENNKTEVKLDY